MIQQQSHDETLNSDQQRNIVLICDSVTSPANLGGLFRLCDAFGVRELLICNSNFDPESNRFKRTARNTQESVTYRVIEDISEAISELKENKFHILGLEITNQSTPIQNLDTPSNKSIALVVGGERHGISDDVLRLTDATVHIEMYGTNSSVNVTHAAAIALFKLSKSS